MINDLISRQAAYDTLTEYYHQKTETQHESLKEALNRVPTIAPEQAADLSGYSDRLWKIAYERGKKEAVLSAQQWIPCSERLPEANTRCLCTYENEEGTCIDFGLYMKRGWFVSSVTAWMPLPEPYKEGTDDTEG